MHRRQFLKGGAGAVALSVAAGCSAANKQPAPGVPVSDFDAGSTAMDVTEGIDLTNRTILVTGCSSGIGQETMRVLALRGAHVIGTSRSLDRARQACADVIGITTPLRLDLADPASIISCANAVRSLRAPLDSLICNAGYHGGDGKLRQVNGIEQHFAINHLGHFLLVNRLLGRLYLANQARVVVVASRAAYSRESGIAFDNLDGTTDYDDDLAYGQSKLANVLFSLHLARLLRGTRITSNALHPGLVNTQIDRHMSWATRTAFAAITSLGAGKSIEQGAATSCHVAASPELGSTSGRYFEDCNAVELTDDPYMQNAQLAGRLWEVSSELVAEHLVVHTGPDYNDFEKAIIERREQQDAEKTGG